jgi:DNA-directed RNA polymerase specialized sigma24 family protein
MSSVSAKRKRPCRESTNGNASPDKDRKLRLLRNDRELVKRCINGDVGAWDAMFQSCQPRLLGTIRSLLRKYGRNASLAEEIASRVWFSLVGGDGDLLERYDASRGCRLTTFFAALARYELLEYWRSERRRRDREQTAADRRPVPSAKKSESFPVMWSEFVETLSRREREFLQQVLLKSDTKPVNGNAYPPLSQVNLWQLRSRVLAKLKRYSNEDKS